MSRLNKSLFFLLLIIFLAILLRLYNLGSIPPSLYSDEISQGYNAYSLLKTARDEHGAFLPVSLRSFGDWKPPLATYLMIPAIYLLGLNETSVRIPSVISGILTVLFAHLVVRLLSAGRKGAEKISLLSAFILAVSPWHILQSRAAMLVAVALFFLISGIFFFIKGEKHQKYYYLGTFLLALSVYAYYGMRVIAPLVLLYLVIRQKLYSKFKILLISAAFGFITILPLLIAFSRNPDVLFGRAKTVSVFYDQGTNLRLWELTTQDGLNANPLITRFFHNRPYLYLKKIAANFLVHFEGNYLFFEGDKALPFPIPGMGILYFLDGIFIVVGLFILFKNDLPIKNFIALTLFIAVVPAALTFMVPSSNRTFNAVFPLSVLSALGLYALSRNKSCRNAVILILTVAYISGFAYFTNMYYLLLPNQFAQNWNYGWREAVKYVKDRGAKYDNIVVSSVNGMPYVYFLFYNKYDPATFQKKAVRNYAADRFGFEHVDSFDRFIFPNEFDFMSAKDNKLKNSLYIVPKAELPPQETSGIDINYPNAKTALKIF